MQGNHDGSWPLRASANGGSGGYHPQPTRMYSNFNIQQPIRYNLQTQQNLNFAHPPQIPTFRPQFHGSCGNVEAIRIDNAVKETRRSLVAAGENVSSIRVSQSVLAQLQQQPDSQRSLGMQMQDVPSLRQLMTLEGKIYAFIHCFIGARGIVTLHDLEVAICRNEFVDCFDDLKLGPLLRHPLVLLYFPSISGCSGPVQITSEEIISFLDSYLSTYGMDDVKLDDFLDYVAEKKSVIGKEKLGVRIQSLRMYVSFIQDAKRQERETLETLLTGLHQKHHNVSSKKQLRDKSPTVSEDSDVAALHRKDYCGKHTRYDSSSSDDDDSGDYEVKYVNSSDHVSSCPYPSVAEEVKKLGRSKKKRKAETKKRKAETRSHEKSDLSKQLRRSPSKLRRGHVKQEIPEPADDSDTKQVFSFNEADFTLSEGALRLFISTWKDACKELSMSMFVEKILSFYNLRGSEAQPKTKRKRAKAMSSFPFVGLLHVARELVTEALEGQKPMEITNRNLVAGYDNSAGTSSRATKPPIPLHNMMSSSTSGNLAHEWNNSISTDLSTRDQFHTGTDRATLLQYTGKKGEEIAFRYYAAKYGKDAVVSWINEQSETGLPYDLVIKNRGGKKEYIEVKATVSAAKDSFNLTVKEWQFANEKGESYVIAHVLLGNSNAILTQHRNLVKLCQEGHLRLMIIMPNQRNGAKIEF
ncbi:protein NO VEIN-LIKE [Brassica rapa]|uniref:Protein NO VEIN C-terminal domain-containing protein n=1 Tax=Brassica campestris TaxID=3711 RepID=M4DQ46_BRACM|nr:protein NO VEIN-LIKE [Brassica rapa]